MRAPVLAALLFLGACAGGPLDTVRSFAKQSFEADTPEKRAEVTQIIVDDLKEAQRAARYHDDPLAEQCWTGLLEIFQGTEEDGFFTDSSKGVFSTYQKTRNTRRLLQSDGNVRVRAACSALKEDSKDAIIQTLQSFGVPIPSVLF